jgi:hypothetical protein
MKKKIIKEDEIKEIGFKESLKKDQFLKEIIFSGNIQDEGCKALNEIFLENKKIEKIDLSGKLFK